MNHQGENDARKAYEVGQELKDRVSRNLRNIENHSSYYGDKKIEFLGLMDNLWKHVEFYPLKLDKTITDPLEAMVETLKTTEIPPEEENLKNFFQDFEKVYTFLSTDKSYEDNLNPFMFCLSDALVGYLSILERYKLIDTSSLQHFLNNQDHWVLIFHYIFGKFPSPVGIPSLYLNYDFESGLKESALTEEIHGLLKLLDEDNWLKMEQIYLVIQLQLNTPPAHPALGFGSKIEKDWNKFKSIFFRPSDIYHIGSTFEEMFNYHTEAKIEELATYIRKHNFIQNRADVLSHLKLLHSMTLFLIKYQMKHSTTEIISSLKQKPFYQQMRVLDKSIKVLSDVLKVAYYKYGEMLQIEGNDIALSHLLSENYLTGMSNIKKESHYEQNAGEYASTTYEKDHGYVIFPRL
ncbi:hypothetical protein PGTUg99_031083 [Puccinia graminis f. sp. tritici]|uniref:Uncharacterized protein n=1 Tax=Puccinia graminis f. sp. tritici TaxID=56615 RepID=A0A5B0ME56_PUCGR|nr:hypothetical protein PGTUg99_031083 [Puccinia graminis f. sp. tritici]